MTATATPSTRWRPPARRSPPPTGRPRTARRLVVATVVAVAVVTAGCGGDDDDSSTAGAGESTVVTTADTGALTTTTADPAPSTIPPDPSAGATTTTTVTPTTAAGQPDPIPWMPTGPGDPLIPRQYGGLVPLGNDDCDDLDQGPDGDVAGSFWDVARQVCLAVRTGAEWPAVDVAPPPPDADGPFASCLDGEVAAVIAAALEWHRQHPDRQPEVLDAGEGQLSACERRVYGLHAVVVGEQDFDGGSVGQVRVEFEIPSRPDADSDDMTVDVDDVQVAFQLDGIDPDRGTRRGRIILDSDWADGHTATVVIRGPTIERQGEVELPRVEIATVPTNEDPPHLSSPTTPALS